MEKVYLYTFYAIAVLFTTSCFSDNEKTEVKEAHAIVSPPEKADHLQNLNISLLLDLSDRINPKKYPKEGMEFYQRDAGYIKAVAGAFVDHLRSKKVSRMDDRIQLFFDPEPASLEINSISEHLKFHVTKKNASLEILDTIISTYTTQPINIYDLAIQDNKFIGSNTWHFFKSNVKDYCIEEKYRNILIILTDGYIYHKDNIIKEGHYTTYLTPKSIQAFGLNTAKWPERILNQKYGFIPATTNLSALEVLVLGINPAPKNPYEDDVLKAYWSNWLTAMDVKHFELKNADLPSHMDKIIKKFILKEKEKEIDH